MKHFLPLLLVFFVVSCSVSQNPIVGIEKETSAVSELITNFDYSIYSSDGLTKNPSGLRLSKNSNISYFILEAKWNNVPTDIYVKAINNYEKQYHVMIADYISKRWVMLGSADGDKKFSIPFGPPNKYVNPTTEHSYFAFINPDKNSAVTIEKVLSSDLKGVSILIASTDIYTHVSLNWNYVLGADRYLVDRRKFGETDWTEIANILSNSYEDISARRETIYEYRIRTLYNTVNNEIEIVTTSATAFGNLLVDPVESNFNLAADSFSTGGIYDKLGVVYRKDGVLKAAFNTSYPPSTNWIIINIADNVQSYATYQDQYTLANIFSVAYGKNVVTIDRDFNIIGPLDQTVDDIIGFVALNRQIAAIIDDNGLYYMQHSIDEYGLRWFSPEEIPVIPVSSKMHNNNISAVRGYPTVCFSESVTNKAVMATYTYDFEPWKENVSLYESDIELSGEIKTLRIDPPGVQSFQNLILYLNTEGSGILISYYDEDVGAWITNTVISSSEQIVDFDIEREADQYRSLIFSTESGVYSLIAVDDYYHEKISFTQIYYGAAQDIEFVKIGTTPGEWEHYEYAVFLADGFIRIRRIFT